MQSSLTFVNILWVGSRNERAPTALTYTGDTGAQDLVDGMAPQRVEETLSTTGGRHVAGTHWIVEGKIDPRWPINTRGNIGEVFPEVLTPLSYTLGVLAAETGWRDAYRQMGILQRNDFKNDDPVIIGLYAGYGYLNISYLRMIVVRAPGSSPKAIDATA